MLLKEQVDTLTRKIAGNGKTFAENTQELTESGIPKRTAFALAYSVMEKRGSDCATIKRLLKVEEVWEAEIYKKYMNVEDDMVERDPLDELKELDAIAGRTMTEQRPAVADVAKAIDADLQKMALVSLARMMHSMGYEKWPHDPEGQEDIQRVVDAVHKEITKMGRKFNSLMSKQMNTLKRLGPKQYEKIIGKWLRGEPHEFEGTSIEKPDKDDTYEDGEEPKREPEVKKAEPEKKPEPAKAE